MVFKQNNFTLNKKFMKRYCILLAAILVAVYAQDCNNPLLKVANNPKAPTKGVLTEPAA